VKHGLSALKDEQESGFREFENKLVSKIGSVSTFFRRRKKLADDLEYCAT
jgi:hypothetical protein